MSIWPCLAGAREITSIFAHYEKENCNNYAENSMHNHTKLSLPGCATPPYITQTSRRYCLWGSVTHVISV